jgi:hypothetical protein
MSKNLFFIDWTNLSWKTNFRLRDLSSIIPRLGEILANPQENLVEFLLLVAIVVLCILLLLVTLLLWLRRARPVRIVERLVYEEAVVEESSGSGTFAEADAGGAGEGAGAGGEDKDGEGAGAFAEAPLTGEEAVVEPHEGEVVLETVTLLKHRRSLWRWLYGTWIVLGVLVIAWLATGLMTSARWSCSNCHLRDEKTLTGRHVAGAANDPHRRVACVRCHEPWGSLGSLTLGVPGRVVHVLSATLNEGKALGYTTPPTDACRLCHKSVLRRAFESATLRVSHREPLAAGLVCTDCHHTSEAGQIGRETSGMQSCLFCHNKRRASAACTQCH